MEIGQEIIQELLILDKIHILFVASSVVVLRILSLPPVLPLFSIEPHCIGFYVFFMNFSSPFNF